MQHVLQMVIMNTPVQCVKIVIKQKSLNSDMTISWQKLLMQHVQKMVTMNTPVQDVEILIKSQLKNLDMILAKRPITKILLVL